MPDLYGAIDLGGTNVRAIVADLDGNVSGDRIQPSRAQRGLDACLARSRTRCARRRPRRRSQPGDLRGIGICSCGWVDSERGIVPAAPQLPGWHNVPLAQIMHERLGPPTSWRTTPTPPRSGEHVFGAGRDVRHLVYITVSTGIGGGIIVDGKLYGGAKGSAGEIGHTVIDPNGPLCGCGNYGCLEIAGLRHGDRPARRGGGEAGRVAGAGRDPGARWPADRRGDRGGREGRRPRLAGDLRGGRALPRHRAGQPREPALARSHPHRRRCRPQSHELFLPQAENTMRALALGEPLKYVRLGLAELGDMAGPLGMIARLREVATVNGCSVPDKRDEPQRVHLLSAKPSV